MGGSQYIYDRKSAKFKKTRITAWSVIRGLLKFLMVSAIMAFVYYIIFALFFSTNTERELRRQNRVYEQEYSALQEKEALLSDVVEGLRVKDDRIYNEIFHTSAPNVDPLSSVDFLMGLDSVPDQDIVMRSSMALDGLQRSADIVEKNFHEIMKIIADSSFVMPPMSHPLEKFSFAQTGASIGDKINPFYKVSIRHNGLDIIAPAGEPVYASADGVVSEVIRSRKGLGNVVEIDHGNGYLTRYAHLSDVEVYRGRKVTKGTRVGYVGMSGNSFAPHLHYEVMRDTVVLDPVNYMFASVTPSEYMNMLILSVSTGQSMD